MDFERGCASTSHTAPLCETSGVLVHHGVPGVLRGPGVGRQTATTSPVVASHDALIRVTSGPRAHQGRARQVSGRRRHPPSPEARRKARGERPDHRRLRSVPPSLPRTPPSPACDGRRCLAHAAVVQRLCATLTIPSVYASMNQRSTDLSVRFGLAGLSASALQGVPCAPQSAATSLSR